MKRTSYIAWIVVALAVCAYTAVAYFALMVAQERQDRGILAVDMQQASVRQASTARLRALVASTIAQRQTLDGFIPSDVLSVAELIQGAGKSAGVALKVSNAKSEDSVRASSDVRSLHAIGFAVQAQGSFPSLMQALAILETLPIATSVQRFEIQRTSAIGEMASATSWHLDVYIRVLSTIPVSS